MTRDPYARLRARIAADVASVTPPVEPVRPPQWPLGGARTHLRATREIGGFTGWHGPPLARQAGDVLCIPHIQRRLGLSYVPAPGQPVTCDRCAGIAGRLGIDGFSPDADAHHRQLAAERERSRYVPVPHPAGEQASRAVLTESAVREMRDRYARGATQRQLAADYGITHQGAASAVLGRTWRHVPMPDYSSRPDTAARVNYQLYVSVEFPTLSSYTKKPLAVPSLPEVVSFGSASVSGGAMCTASAGGHAAG